MRTEAWARLLKTLWLRRQRVEYRGAFSDSSPLLPTTFGDGSRTACPSSVSRAQDIGGCDSHLRRLSSGGARSRGPACSSAACLEPHPRVGLRPELLVPAA